MKFIDVDFNAMTEEHQIRLTLPCSEADMQRLGIRPGDWAWLTDSEVLVGARVDEDPIWGVVGTIHWDTLVHLDDDEATDFLHIWAELQGALQPPEGVAVEASRIFQLLTIFEKIAPANVKAATSPGYLSYRRSAALLSFGEPELALIEVEEALQARPHDSKNIYLYLELLRKIDPDRAAIEAEALAESGTVNALALVACINIASTVADRLSGERFDPLGRKILEWSERFESAPGRDRVHASLLAQVQLNRGLALLRLGRREEARRAMELAHAADPSVPAIDPSESLDARALEVAEQVRSRAPLIAA